MNNQILDTLTLIKSEIKNLYGDKFIKLILYGSYANNSETIESDIDLLVLLKTTQNRFKEIRRINQKILDIILKTDKLFSIKVTDENTINNLKEMTFYKNVLSYGLEI